MLAAIPRIGHIGLHDASGGTGPEALVGLDTFTLDFSEWNEIFAGATDLVIEGLTVSRDIPGLDAQALQMMDTLGYDELVFGASLTDRWSVDEGRDEAVWTFSLENGADIEVSYELTGVTAEWVIDAIGAETEPVQMKLLSRLGLAGAALRLTDRSLLDRGFDAAVMLQGLSVDGPTYREQIRGAIPFMLSTALPEALANMIGEPLQSYVGGGQTLVAEINPPEPIPLLTLMNEQGADPAATAAMLGLTLRTEPAPELEAPDRRARTALPPRGGPFRLRRAGEGTALHLLRPDHPECGDRALQRVGTPPALPTLQCSSPLVVEREPALPPRGGGCPFRLRKGRERGRRPTYSVLTTRIASSRSCFGVTSDGAPISRSSRLLVHREHGDLAQILRAADEHDDAVEPRRHAAMRRRAELQRAQHAAELLLRARPRRSRRWRRPFA